LYELSVTVDQVPVRVFWRAGLRVLAKGQSEQAKEVFLRGAKLYNYACLWLGVGVACFRLEQLLEAEDALQQANLLDPDHAHVWGFYTLVCLSSGSHRLSEAVKAHKQALRLGLEDGPLLRQVAVGFMAFDKHETAEDILRRALAGSAAGDIPGLLAPCTVAQTRKLLADVLVAQNQVSNAITEYQRVASDDAAAWEDRQEVS
jgi:tetratricopeptide (TPR) repeat protein